VLGCVFDVHGNLPALEAVLEDAHAAGVGRFVLGGDYAAFGGWPAECAALADALDAAVRIRGNWERWVADPPPEVRADAETAAAAATVRAALGPELVAAHGALPAEMSLDASTLVCHASPGSDMDGFAPAPCARDAELLAGVTARRLLVGHTHRQFRRTAAGVEIVNPGSVGLPLDGDRRAAWAVLGDDGSIELRRVEYDVAAAIHGLRALGRDAAWVPVIAARLESAAP
jgi:diadenosine tetraphosphatase ApaH/serine/threonine PP2A family protein phosphatase